MSDLGKNVLSSVSSCANTPNRYYSEKAILPTRDLQLFLSALQFSLRARQLCLNFRNS
eukprot:COSAG02_NODE_23821_length_707_cov_0.925987_1_plen_57_part_10